MLSQDYCQRSGYSISGTANYKHGPRLFVSTQYHIKAMKSGLLTKASGYNPPKYVTDAAKDALNKVECNQYSPTKVCYDTLAAVELG